VDRGASIPIPPNGHGDRQAPHGPRNVIYNKRYHPTEPGSRNRPSERAQQRRFFYKAGSPLLLSNPANPPACNDGENEEHYLTFQFDGTLLELGPEEEAFSKVETGIQDPEELRKHIIDVHEEAYKVSTPILARWLSVT